MGLLYRAFIPPLAARYRCIVPDHMGMGKSATPPDAARYHLRQHIDNLESLLLALDLRDITLVLHDWGGPVGLGFATRHPERIKRLVLLNTWAFAAWPGPMPRLTELIRSARGEAFVLKRNGYLEPALLGATHYPERLTQTVHRSIPRALPDPGIPRRDALLVARYPGARGDASFEEMARIEQGLGQFVETPSLLIWGMNDLVLPPAVLRQWQARYPHAIIHEIDDANHFLQEDAPERIIGWIAAFLAAYP